MTDTIEIKMKYARLIDIIRQAIPPADPDDGPVKRGSSLGPSTGGPPPQPWKTGVAGLSGAIVDEMMLAIGLKVVAEKAGNAAAKDRADFRINALLDGWCGNEPIIIVIGGGPWPDPNPEPEWMANPVWRSDDLVSGMMAQISTMQPGPVASAAMDIALQIMKPS